MDPRPARPNIVLITSDQQRGDCFGFEGRAVKTPHLDELAREGTRAASCVTPSLVCQPARASILTGLLPLTHGVWDNGIDLDEQVAQDGFAATLGRAGYDTGFIGKAHFSTWITFEPTGRPENQASTADYPDDWTGPYMGFDHVELTVMGHFTPDRPGMHYERWLYDHGSADEIAKLFETRLPPDVGAAQTWSSAVPAAWHNSTWCADRAIAFVNDHQRGRRADDPFCLWVSFPDPHHPFDCPEPWSRLHDPADVDLPVHRTRDLDGRPWWHRAALESTPQVADEWVRQFRAEKSRIPDQTDEQLAHLIANYYGMIALIDHNVGRILKELGRLGLREDTYVVFTSDHGDWLGDHGLILKGPMAYEGLLRVGLIVRGPGVPAGQVIDAPVSTLDLPATFLDWAGASPPRDLHARSLRGVIDGTEDRDHAYTEWDVHRSRCGVDLQLRTVRTRTHKLTLELGSGAGELYDLDADPHELTNVFDDPRYAGVVDDLTDAIHQRPDDQIAHKPEPIGMA